MIQDEWAKKPKGQQSLMNSNGLDFSNFASSQEFDFSNVSDCASPQEVDFSDITYDIIYDIKTK